MILTPDEISALIAELGSRRAAARELGLAESTLRKMHVNNEPVRVAESFGRVKTLEKEIESLRQKVAVLTGPKTRVILGKQDRSTRVVAIGDTHDQPGMNKDRFKWIARHIAEVRPDRVVQIGDFASWDSVSTHEPVGSAGHGQRPSFKNDLESCEEAMALFYNEIRGLEIPMELTAGNHEDRIARFENSKPETVGALYIQFEEVCARYCWRLQPYGYWLFIDGVGFTHVPKNIMGKPYGGQNSENAIANHATHSVVFGHTHRSTFRKTPKIGINNSIEVLNLGSAMPDGYVAKYVGTATSGWSYGIFDLKIKGGHIVSHHFIDMAQLEATYG
jgi:predicted phosphodiesterase